VAVLQVVPGKEVHTPETVAVMAVMLDLIPAAWAVALVAQAVTLVMAAMAALDGYLLLLVLQKNIQQVLMDLAVAVAVQVVPDIQRLLYQLLEAAESDYWVKVRTGKAVHLVRNIQVLLVQVAKMDLLAAQEVLFMSVQDVAVIMAAEAAAPDTDYMYLPHQAEKVRYELYGAMVHHSQIMRYNNGLQLYTGILYTY
jgi:hypothetical protein